MSIYRLLHNNQIIDFRSLGDPKVDAIWSQKSIPELRSTIALLNSNSDLSRSPDLRKLIPEEPVWIDWDKIKAAQSFFAKNGQEILTLLGFAALPYCYAHANGAQVLAASDRLQNDANKRLLETSTFVFDCCRPNSFDQNGHGFAAAIKVRLIHSMIRYHLTRSDWDSGKYGYPVNQMDVAGTNLAFSLITIRGMRKLGVEVSNDEAECYLHLWNYISYLMGLDEKLIPKTMREAYWLSKKIYALEVRRSEEGEKLTKAMITAIKEQPEAKDFRLFIEPLIHFALGDDCARILNVETSSAHQVAVLFRAFRSLSQTFNVKNGWSNAIDQYDSMINKLDEKPTLRLP